MTSQAERERRYAALSSAMARDGLDALVICARSEKTGRGRLRYVTDVDWAWGQGFCILPAQGSPVLFSGPIWAIDAEAKWVGWVTDCRQGTQLGVDVGRALREMGLGQGALGLVGRDLIGLPEWQDLRATVPDADIRDGDALFDRVRMVKSPEEIAALEETSRILRGGFETIEAHLAPGCSEREVIAHAQHYLAVAGCVDGLALIARTPFTAFRRPSGELVRGDEVVVVGLDYAGPSGYWCELRRCYSFGAPPPEARDYWNLRVEVFEACRRVLRPGLSSDAVLEAKDKVCDGHDLPSQEIVTWSAHGIGLDVIERPIAPGLPESLAENMVLSLHPTIRLPDEAKPRIGRIAISDNVVVTESGGRRLSDSADQWVEL